MDNLFSTIKFLYKKYNLFYMNFKEKHALFLLAIISIFTTLYISSFPYDLETGYTVPDEKAYYDWALIFAKGKYYIPVEEIDGNYVNVSFLEVKNSSYQAMQKQKQLLKPPPQKQMQPSLYQIFALAEYKNGTLIVYVYDIYNKGVENANVSVLKDGQQTIAIGKTDKSGEFEKQLNLTNGKYTIISEKRIYGEKMPYFAVVVKVNGKFAVANRWYPGYSYFLIPFIKLGVENYVSFFLCAIALISVYLIARKLFNWKIAFVSSVLFLTNAIALMQLFSRGMADYSSMTFAILGFLFFVYGVDWKNKNGKSNFENVKQNLNSVFENKLNNFYNNKFIKIFFLILSGIFFGIATSMRYSTIVVVFAIFFYLIAILYSLSWKDKLYKNKSIKLTQRFLPSKNSLLYSLKIFILFFIGLMIIGSLIAYYNNSLFASPLNAGYQMQTRIEMKNGTAEVSQPNETFFEQQFGNARIDSIKNLPRLFSLFFFVMPILFLIPYGIFKGRKSLEIWTLLIFALPIFILYMSMSWVANWGNDVARTLEDMRYFLPSLPSVAIISGFAICEVFWKEPHLNQNSQNLISEEVSENKKNAIQGQNSEFWNAEITNEIHEFKVVNFENSQQKNSQNSKGNYRYQNYKKENPNKKIAIAILIISLLIISNFATASLGIDAQLNRKKGIENPQIPQKEQYKLTTINELIANSEIFNGKLVRIENVFVKTVAKDNNKILGFAISDNSNKAIDVRLINNPKIPQNIKENFMINIQGMFIWIRDKDEKFIELSGERIGDIIELLHRKTNISELYQNAKNLSGILVRVENAKVVSIKDNEGIILINDNTIAKNMTVRLVKNENNKNVPMKVSELPFEVKVNNILNVQGMFNWNDNGNKIAEEIELSIGVMKGTTDKVEVIE